MTQDISISTATETSDLADKFRRSTDNVSFDNAPFYRKRWMVVVSALFFIPVALVILLTGPVYQNDGEVWDQKRRVGTAIALCVFMVFTFLRLSVTPS